jgi:formate/nitrite transporter FocA (FNT family)
MPAAPEHAGIQGAFTVHVEERRQIEQRTAPTGKVVHEAIRREGESELGRTASSLAWSGLAAGLSMGFSFLGVGLLHAYLPDAPWTPLVSSFGYTLGFLVVVLGRQQLFTENTLTVVLPLMEWRRAAVLRGVLRLWAVVLVANTVGALLFAFTLARTEVVEVHVFQALRQVAVSSASDSFAVALLRGVFAGWIIALMVWLGPFAESARIWVIVILTYIVGLAHFTHVVASTIDAAFLVFVGDSSWNKLLMHVFVPGLIGNIIGGVAMVAALNHAQVAAGDRAIDT